jgi:hypothetical protein
MEKAYLVTGSLTDSRTIHLDEPIPVSTGKVRVPFAVEGPPGCLSGGRRSRRLDPLSDHEQSLR